MLSESAYIGLLMNGNKRQDSLTGVWHVRHAHIHRESIHINFITDAFFNDSEIYSHFKREYMLVLDGPPDSVGANIDSFDCIKGHQVLAMIRTVLEVKYFEIVPRDYPDPLYAGEVFEQHEFPNWKCAITSTQIEKDEFQESSNQIEHGLPRFLQWGPCSDPAPGLSQLPSPGYRGQGPFGRAADPRLSRRSAEATAKCLSDTPSGPFHVP